jgi:transposase
MTKFKTILRLASLGVSQRQIAQSCQVGQATISDYLAQAKHAQLRWPDIADWDEDRIQQALAPAPNPAAVRRKNAEPNFAAIRRELQVHKHLTLQLLWEEYQLQNPDGYRYSRFCDLYRHWLQRQDVVLRQEHRAGEKLFVDYAGDTLPVTNPVTGELQSAAVFVAVLGASNYTFAEATWTQSLPDWIGSHLRAFEFLGGVPAIAVPDNLKAGVTRACRYEPELNRTYEEMAAHYGVAIIPARRRKPRDKAKVEAGVLVVERWIMAALRKRQFFSLRAVNAAITELLTRLNDRPFRKADGTRRSRHHRDLPQEHPGGQPSAQPGTEQSDHRRRAPTQSPPALPAMDALALNRVGPEDRPADRRTRSEGTRIQAPPRARIPVLSGHHPAGRRVRRRARGGRGPPCAEAPYVLVQELGVDPRNGPRHAARSTCRTSQAAT